MQQLVRFGREAHTLEHVTITAPYMYTLYANTLRSAAHEAAILTKSISWRYQLMCDRPPGPADGGDLAPRRCTRGLEESSPRLTIASAFPVAVPMMPVIAALFPAIRYPVVTATLAHPSSGNPHMRAAAPLP